MATSTHKQFITQLASETSAYLRNHFYALKNVFEQKQGGQKNNIELSLEKTIAKRISDAYPEDGIMLLGGEQINKQAERVWVIDALDGSAHFSRNIPMYAATFALVDSGNTVLSAVVIPQTNELYVAEKGKGAARNGIGISVSSALSIAKAFVYIELPEQKFFDQTTSKKEHEKYTSLFTELVKQCGQVESFRIGSIGQCMVASSAFDAYIDLSGSSRKEAQRAGRLMLEESGAEIFELDSASEYVRLLAANKELASALKGLVGG